MSSCRVYPRDSASWKHNHADSLSSKPFLRTVVSTVSKRSRPVSAEAKFDGQSQQEANLGELVYTLSGLFTGGGGGD